MAGADETNALPTNQPDFHYLIQQAQNGNVQAREALFDQLRPYLMVIANDQLDDRLHAKLGPSDIVQNSMLRAVEQLPQYRGGTEAEFKGWLRQILVNETRLARRGFATDKRDVRREQGLNASESGTVSHEPADQGLTPATDALADEQALAVKRLISGLPETYQTVIRLRNWEEMSFEQIGHRMGMSTSGVAKIWYRALVEIQKIYQRENESRIR